MTIMMDQLIKAISAALDIVEGELLGASTHHGKRVAVLCAAMGRGLGMDEVSVSSLVTCALLHDNALTEYILSEREGGFHDPAMKTHCEIGQRNADTLGFPTDISGFVLYHHECASGTGAFGKKEGEYPVEAALIQIADSLDVTRHLQRVSLQELPAIRAQIEEMGGIFYTRGASQALLKTLDEKTLLSLRDEHIAATIELAIPHWPVDMEDHSIQNLAGFVTRIIDYKSEFTKRHSAQIANKAYLLSEYYGYNKTLRAQVYLAAALHDIGKLAIPSAILEKPGRLDDDEFTIIKSHAYKTWELLKDIAGFEDICAWASNHHEKLDGTGYPFGKKASELDFISRLIACIDIYQAVSEDRPYHGRRSHRDSINILLEMAGAGVVDKSIVQDLDKVLSDFSCQDVPPPP
ncbi:MAG: HD domain-containing protein [Treponema sp.]|jgi:HD-GYP domain-containing protein (c-di-GMP phosphodiesterase class II)|nr:HD domain-containing protein [Treponema sp.]